jgi:glycosyltransferase involved in cell wall biosynthesis
LCPPILVKAFNFFRVLTKGVLGYKNSYLSNIVRQLQKTKKYDFIFVRYIESLMIFGIKPAQNVIIDLDDLPEQVKQSKMELNVIKDDNCLKKIIYKLYYLMGIKTSRYYTRKIAENVYAVYLSNEQQCSLFKNSVYLPNIPYPFNSTEAIKKSRYQIVFVGRLTYKPNYLGVECFLNNVYPLILKKIPEVNFKIIGKISEEIKKNWLLQYKNISVPGFVSDLKKEYDNASVVVVPIYHGGGTNIKVLEAMSQGKACVISSFAGRGFDNLLENGENILIAEDYNDFAEKTIKLLEDRKHRKKIGKSAKNAVDKQYSFEYFSEMLLKTIKFVK